MKKKKFKITKKKEEKIVIIGECPVCDLKVRGSTEDQVSWNLTLHMNQKHSEYFKEKSKKREKN